MGYFNDEGQKIAERNDELGKQVWRDLSPEGAFRKRYLRLLPAVDPTDLTLNAPSEAFQKLAQSEEVVLLQNPRTRGALVAPKEL